MKRSKYVQVVLSPTLVLYTREGYGSEIHLIDNNFLAPETVTWPALGYKVIPKLRLCTACRGTRADCGACHGQGVTFRNGHVPKLTLGARQKLYDEARPLTTAGVPNSVADHVPAPGSAEAYRQTDHEFTHRRAGTEAPQGFLASIVARLQAAK